MNIACFTLSPSLSLEPAPSFLLVDAAGLPNLAFSHPLEITPVVLPNLLLTHTEGWAGQTEKQSKFFYLVLKRYKLVPFTHVLRLFCGGRVTVQVCSPD